MRILSSLLFGLVLPACSHAASVQEASNALAKLPLSFEQNRGQASPHWAYISRGPGSTLYLTPTEMVLVAQGRPLRMKLAGANPKAKIEGVDRLPGVNNYFLGNDPSQWRTSLPNYAKVAIRNAYPGIDLIFYWDHRQLEYDAVVAPGADPNRIQMNFEGASSVREDANGDLAITASGAEFRQRKPVIYQKTGNSRREVQGRYVRRGSNGFAFQLSSYNARKALIIDPSIFYSSYLGGGAADTANAVTADVRGNLYVTGSTLSLDFPNGSAYQPKTAGLSDVFVTKINPQGVIVYSTYLGGDGPDTGRGIALDSSGNVYITGSTAHNQFPGIDTFPNVNALENMYQGNGDAFVTKLDPTGSTILYSTFLGGNGTDQGNAIAVDGNGNVFVTGSTTGSFPIFRPIQSAYGGGTSDAFVTGINPQGRGYIFSTNFGGSGADSGNGIAVDSQGNAYVTGVTAGGVPIANALQSGYGGGASDAFVAKINPGAATLTYSTYLGGSGVDSGNAIAVDGNGGAYITGSSSGNFPLANALQSTFGGGTTDAFVTKLNAAGSALTYSTYLGGTNADAGYGIAVDVSGNAYVTGSTGATANFPILSAVQAVHGGGASEAFVTKLNPSASAIVYSTYLGGAGDDRGTGIAVDGVGNAYVAGTTSSLNLFTFRPFQPQNSGSTDAFVSVISSNTIANPVLDIRSTHTGPFTRGQLQAVYTLTVSNAPGAAVSSGLVTVTENVPMGLTLTSMSGPGWSCSGTTCVRGDGLAGGSSYPPITVKVNVASFASSPLVNQVTVSGGSSTAFSSSDSTIVNLPVMTLSRTTLNFGRYGTTITDPQTVAITFTEPGIAWTAVANPPTLKVTPAGGTGNGTITVSALGGANGIITVSAEGVIDSPLQIQVVLNPLVTPGTPFGNFETPVDNTTGIAGAIAVTGWALDPIEVTKVDIWRDRVGAEPVAPNGLVYIGDATFVAGARPDVEAAYPYSPLNYRAGWGYLMLTTSLPSSDGSGGKGNGTFKIRAFAHNISGGTTELGVHTITLDNAHATRPFGTLDTPAPGATISGNSYINFGWAVTQNPYCIPTDGSTITVTVDGVALGHPVYNQFRNDIASTFPGLCNSPGPVGYFFLDTTQFADGLHTIGWLVSDNAGRADGIGSRFFNIANNIAPPTSANAEPMEAAQDRPDKDGGYHVEMEQLGIMELHANATSGYQLVAGERRPLPVGSTLKGGVFYWQPGPGYLGEFQIKLVRSNGEEVPVHISIRPKRYRSEVQ